MQCCVYSTLGALAAGACTWFQCKRKAGAAEDVPKKMRRVVLLEANKDIKLAKLEVQEVDMPKPRSGQVLVKVAASAINPSDDGVWKVEPKQGYPFALGNEGSGKVVQSGGGYVASRLLGRNVAFGGKAYAEYACVDAMQVFSLPDQIPVGDACSFFVNPFTVIGIVDTVKTSGGKVFIHTAAASQLGIMMVRYCKQVGMTVVNLVRRPEQVEVLQKAGAEHIVNTGDTDWQSKLEVLIKELGIKHAFDCIAGDMPGTILTMMPPGSSLWVYGRLSDQAVGGVQPLDLIYRGKKIQGFLLTNWLFKGGQISALRKSMRTASIVKKYLNTVFASSYKDTNLDDLHKDYIAFKASGNTGLKMRVQPHGPPVKS